VLAQGFEKKRQRIPRREIEVGEANTRDYRDRKAQAQSAQSGRAGEIEYLVGYLMIQARLARHVGQRELARRCGKARSTIARNERARTGPTVATPAAFARALDATLQLRLLDRKTGKKLSEVAV
jgi:ribosome-binding protein aMBF1 (putative translation factor)